MRHVLILLWVFYLSPLYSQTYDSHNVSLLGKISPVSNTVLPSPTGSFYSGCWGWFQASKNKEYAIIGAVHGTYFIDVTSPTSPSISAFVPGKPKCVWREIKTYQNYCYIISDDSGPNRFQIVDMSALPDSVNIVKDDNTFFERGHTIWIDRDKMYIGGITYSVGSMPIFSPMAVFSLATPTAPLLLKNLDQDISNNIIPYVHDMYVRNDTIYASCLDKGLYILKFDPSNNTFSLLGSFQNYGNNMNNHSSFLTQDGKHLIFCDEVPEGQPIRLVNTENFSNVQPIKSFRPSDKSIPHNPYVIGDQFAIVSCNQDGLYIYDISTPTLVSQSGFFDTYPQGGFPQDDYSGYRGNWGAYPFLPSGNIIANDRQNGVFILDPTEAYSTNEINPVDHKEITNSLLIPTLFPNPAQTFVHVQSKNPGKTKLELFNILGQTVYYECIIGSFAITIDIQNLPKGAYCFRFTFNSTTMNNKLIISD